MSLTLAYITFRKENHIEWFFDSLKRETQGAPPPEVIVVDYHATQREYETYGSRTPPKPSVWQGPHRLTSKNYFAAANARNTALCLAPDGWIAYVDDLSILMPGWLAAVQRAMRDNYIVLGAYKKVRELSLVDDPVRASFKEHPPGVDSRWPKGSDGPVRAGGSWLYGCSCAMPVEALLSVGGWDENCDSLGGEDYICGIMLEKKGYEFRYDRNMLTLESEEGHHTEPSLPRFDKGTSPNDKSHAILNRVLRGEEKCAPDFSGLGSIRAVRERVLSGLPFPVPTTPTVDWYDQQPLASL